MSTFWSARLSRPCLHKSFFNSSRVYTPRRPLSAPPTGNVTQAPPISPASFRDKLATLSEPVSFSERIPRPKIARHVIFAVLGSFMAFNTAAFATNIDTEEWCDRLIEADPFSRYSPVSSDIRKARYLQLGKDLQTSLNDVKNAVSGLPQTIQFGVVYTYAKAAQYYLDNTEHRHAVWTVGGVFATVWMAWKIRRWQPFMTRCFLHDPLSTRVSTMLTSVFSHQSFIHLGFNTMALAGFGASTMVYMQQSQEHNEMGMPESTQAYHFFAFFIAAGLFSSLTSQIVSARFKYPRLIARLSREASLSPHPPRTFSFAEALSRPAESASASAKQAASERSSAILPSLGGSGAIYACVTLTALAFPDAVVSLIFPPTSPIPIQIGVGGLVLLDIIGALRGWRMFDHWAHLGGAAFGAFYFRYGPRFWDWMRSLDAEMVTVDEDGTVVDLGQMEFVEEGPGREGSEEDQRR